MTRTARGACALLLLAGCTGTDIIDPVEEQLAARVVDAAALPIRLTTAVGGVLAATCAADSYPDTATDTVAGQALGLPSAGPSEVEDGSALTWEWVDVGLDDVKGRLTVDRNATGTQYTAVFQAADSARTLQVAYTVVYCDAAATSGPTGAPRSQRVAAVAPLTGLLAFGPPPPPTSGEDADGDGYTTPQDCDDADDTIHPGATETWYDGVDQNCDARDDFDQDNDGHAAEGYAAAYAAYTPPDDPLPVDDCDDERPGVHPGAAEEPGDGIDQDCDGEDGGATAVLSATGVWVGEGDDATAQLDLKGSPPYAGLEFDPNTVGLPTAGYVTWKRPSTGDSIQMDDASTISGDEWTGVATASDWERAIVIPLP